MPALCYTSWAFAVTFISGVPTWAARLSTVLFRLGGDSTTVCSHYFGDPTDIIGHLDSMEPVLRVLRRVTGLRIVLVARVTDTSWTACAVLDDADFGLKPGDQLELSNTY